MATTNSIVVTVPESIADIVTDRMWQWGVQAVSEIQAPGGGVEVSTSVGNDPVAVERAIATLDPGWTWEVRAVDDSIAQVAAEFLSPTWYSPGMVSVPSSLAPFDPDDPEALVTVIDPGSAFGLGDHPTTRTSMALLARLLRAPGHHDGPADALLDVGCGTGALAVLAAQLGVSQVRAIDIADAAVEATLRNMQLNDVVDRVQVDTTLLADVARTGATYDIVMANILAPVLVELAGDLRRVVRPGGSLVISGVLTDRHQHVLDALHPLVPFDSLDLDGWSSVVLR